MSRYIFNMFKSSDVKWKKNMEKAVTAAGLRSAQSNGPSAYDENNRANSYDLIKMHERVSYWMYGKI